MESERHLFVVAVLLLLLLFAGPSRGDDYQPSEPSRPLSRSKRSLLYPPPSTLLLIFGLGTPLQLDRESVLLGAFTKLIYTLPQNSSDGAVGSAGSRTDRWSVYAAIGRLLGLMGLGDGRACLMRAVCEAAAAPFAGQTGLLQQLLHVLLTPSSTREPYREYADRQFSAAEQAGRSGPEEPGCHALYPECPRSLLQLFSAVSSG